MEISEVRVLGEYLQRHAEVVGRRLDDVVAIRRHNRRRPRFEQKPDLRRHLARANAELALEKAVELTHPVALDVSAELSRKVRRVLTLSALPAELCDQLGPRWQRRDAGADEEQEPIAARRLREKFEHLVGFFPCHLQLSEWTKIPLEM